jgi:hypothetical protein
MVRLVDITDGTSTTLLVVEDAGRPKHWLAGRVVVGEGGQPKSIPGGAWASSAVGVDVRGTSPAEGASDTPCALNCSNDREVYSSPRRGQRPVRRRLGAAAADRDGPARPGPAGYAGRRRGGLGGRFLNRPLTETQEKECSS